MIQLWYTFDENYACPPPGSAPPPPATTLKPDDAALVSTSGGCLNLRGGTGVTYPVLECIPDGSRVNVTGTPEPSAGYTWVPIAAPSGKTGWAASDYLVAAPAAPPPPAPPAPTPTVFPFRVIVRNVGN
jgi:hypothetical protein